MLELVLEGLLLGGSAAAQPGPFQAYLVQQSIERGPRRALPIVLAPLLSDGPVVLLVVFVLSVTPEAVLSGLAIGGGVYLIWLAVRTARRRADERGSGLGTSLARAALVNLLAPGPYLFWGLVLGPIVIDAARQSASRAAGFVGAFYVAMLTVNAGLVTVFGWASARGERVTRVLRWASVVALAGFGVYSVVDGLAGTWP